MRAGLGAIAAATLLALAGLGQPAHSDDQRDLKARTAGATISWAAENGRLRQVLEAFPKGGDIHTHLRGAVYAESWLDWAAEDGLCVDTSIPAIKFREGADCAASGWMTADAARLDKDVRHDLINALSTRSYVPTSGWSGHDQFFATFDRINVNAARLGDQLAEVADRAGRQNVLYLEIMETIVLPELFPLLADVKLSGDMAADYKTLIAGPFGKAMPGLVASVRKQIADAMARKDQLLGCGTDAAKPGCDVEIRLLHQVIREMSPALVYGQFILGWQVMQEEPMVVGANLVAPEDGYIALRDYSLHMHMIDWLYRNKGARNISLHAGELAIGLVDPKELTFHIREAIDLGHAKRIGHGVAVAYEDNSAELLEHMAKEGIMVEINLTSNDTILGISGRDHPLALYRDMDVPYALSTDDEGVSRIDLTHEYVRYWRTYKVPYFEMRHASRNALTYSFLPGESLWKSAPCEKDVAEGAAAGADCSAFLKTSEKARLQWKLEERFRAFEDEQRIPRRKTTSFN
ncbi:MAG: adenosine deaminase [Alphaproteobacteria bacterium]|nr:MAG: adenosine deaminase [Alphaproteobacteria bacterium]